MKLFIIEDKALLVEEDFFFNIYEVLNLGSLNLSFTLFL